jgi:hypothetical protein
MLLESLLIKELETYLETQIQSLIEVLFALVFHDVSDRGDYTP